jgi:acyl phosphate:glycerol-3-phosphate acyltransferase
VDWVLTIMIGYLAGSVPASLLVARSYGVDLRRTSDGNPGAWNLLEQVGPRRAVAGFVGDAAKGALGAGAGLLLSGGDTYVGYAGAGAAMLGHAFPAFARLRGGKAIMTFVGGMLVVAEPAGLLALALCIVVALLARSFAYGARAGVFGVVPLQLLTDPVDHVAATGVLMTLIGALFGLRALQARRPRTSAPATSARAAPPPS